MKQTPSETAHRGRSRGLRTICQPSWRPSPGKMRSLIKHPRSAARHTPLSLRAPVSAPQTLSGTIKQSENCHETWVEEFSRGLTTICRAVRKFQGKNCSVAKLVSNQELAGSKATMNADRRLTVCQTLQSRGAGFVPSEDTDRDSRWHATTADRPDREWYSNASSPLEISAAVANPFSDALSLEKLKRIVVDASHIDQKKRGITDMRETMMPLAKLLCRKALKERYEDETAQHIDLIFY